MSRDKLDGRLEQITKLLEEVVEDNTALVAELRRIERGQRSVGADVEAVGSAVSALRGDLSGALAYHALRDLCREVIGPLSAIEAMLDHGDFGDPAVVAGHLRSLALTVRAVLARMGAEKVPVVPGVDMYDPARHRCIAVLRPEESPLPDAAPNTVVRVVADGYALHERPLTPVHVEIQAARRPSGSQQ